MPGTYPRSTNPYFAFDRLEWIEKQLFLFHNLKHSANFVGWALSTVFTSSSSAEAIASLLNKQRSSADGRYVVVPANQIIVWCRAIVFEKDKRPTPSIQKWTAPVAEEGYIIVWEPKDQVVMTEAEYIGLFGLTRQIEEIIRIVRPWSQNNPFSGNASSPHIQNKRMTLSPIEYEPVRKLPFIEYCSVCGEEKTFCGCIKDKY